MLWDFETLLFFKYTSLETLAVVTKGTQPSSDPFGIFGPSAGVGASSTSARVKCKVCGESWQKSKVQQHIGAHILQEHWKQWPSKIRPRWWYPCGLCGLRGALGGDPKKAQDEGVSGCCMWIDQNGKKGMHECTSLGSVSYNLSTSSKCALSVPCTNRPFKCKMPGCNMYVWTYSMETHYAKNDQGAEISEDIKNQVLLKPHERTYVNRLVVAYTTKGLKTVCPTLMKAMKNKEATCTCALECD